ncbi:MAG: helix-hairpin-helix domain-containing protein [Planctomycetota bacterium]|nr:MAG: helix-hairpin-helix domain-containing protein [Planctomycetota bacterium]
MPQDVAPTEEATAGELLSYVRRQWWALVGWLFVVAAVGSVVRVQFPAVGQRVDPPVWKLDINRATAGQFEALPQVGPVLAQRIIDYRRRHGRFRAVEDLLQVRGFGPKTLERLRPHLVCEQPAMGRQRQVESGE